MHFFFFVYLVITTGLDVVVHLVWWLWWLWGAIGCLSPTSSRNKNQNHLLHAHLSSSPRPNK